MFSHVLILQPERVTPSPDNKGFGVTSDVWSFGITMVIMWFDLIFLHSSYIVVLSLVSSSRVSTKMGDHSYIHHLSVEQRIQASTAWHM